MQDSNRLSSVFSALCIDDSIVLTQQGPILSISLNRPQCRNAMNLKMVNAIQQVFQAIQTDRSIRAVVLRGVGGNFCAGGDLKEMQQLQQLAAQTGSNQVYADFNRQFGEMLIQVDQAPQSVVVVLEGVVLGGGLGLACVSDVAIGLADAQFGLPETQLGVIPAQIAPFLLERIGLTQTRRLALLGLRFNALEALRLGILHEVFEDITALNAALISCCQQIGRVAPEAARRTKALLHRNRTEARESLLDDAAQQFADAVTGPEGVEGTLAFMQKRAPAWQSHLLLQQG